MGKLEADIGFAPRGLTGLDQTLLGPEPLLIFTVITSSDFRVLVWYQVLLWSENFWWFWWP